MSGMTNNSPHRPLDEPPTHPKLQIGQRWNDAQDHHRVVEIIGYGSKVDPWNKRHPTVKVVVVKQGRGYSLGRKTEIRIDNILRRFRYSADEQKDNS